MILGISHLRERGEGRQGWDCLGDELASLPTPSLRSEGSVGWQRGR